MMKHTRRILLRLRLLVRIRVNKSIRWDSPRVLISYFRDLDLAPSQVSFIVEDLFAGERKGTARSWSYYLGTESGNTALLRQLCESGLVFPSAFTEAVLRHYMASVKGHSSYSYRALGCEWMRQPGISEAQLMETIKWAAEMVDVHAIYEEMIESNPTMGTKPLDVLFGHPSVSEEMLMALCHHKNRMVRQRAYDHPLCPEEYIISGILLHG